MNKNTTILILVALLLGETAFFLVQYGPAIFVRPLFNMGRHEPLVLTSDIAILNQSGEPVGTLRRGTVVYPACLHDSGQCDPGDVTLLYKFYLPLLTTAWTSSVGKVSDAGQDFPYVHAERVAPLSNHTGNANQQNHPITGKPGSG